MAVFYRPVEKKKVMYKKILLTRMKYIGDVVLTTPVIKTLREAFPDSYIAYLGDSNAVSLLEHNPNLDEIIPFDFSKDSVLYQMNMYAGLFSRHFDLSIDLFSNPRSALLTYATRAKVRIGGDSKTRGKLYTVRIRDDGKPKSAIDYHYQSLKPVGVQPKHFTTEIFLTEQEKTEARNILSANGINVDRKIVALHPGGTWPAKLWQKEKFAELARALSQKDISVILSGGSNDNEVTGYVRTHSNAVTLGNVPLRTVAAVYSQCNALVSNDCGVMHISVAVGTPTVGIFGPGQEQIWFPYSPPHKALRKHVFCNPCHLNVCNRQGNEYMECMQLLTVDEVLSSVLERI